MHKTNTVTLTLADIAAHVGRSTGRNVESNWVSRNLREIDPPHGAKYTPSKRFTAEQRDLLTLYAREWHHRHNAPGLRDWMSAHNHSIPSPFSPPAKTAQPKARKTASPDPDVTSLVKRVTELEAKIEKLSRVTPEAPRKAIEAPKTDKELEALKGWVQKQVKAFCFNNNISITSLWKRIEALYAENNKVVIDRAKGQSFPQWLRQENRYLSFAARLPEYLKTISDELNPQHRLEL